jgi:hypothetical protein
MRKIIKMQDLSPEKRTQLMRVLDRNRVKNSNRKARLSKIHLRSIPFGLTDYLKYINDKLKR